MLKWYADWTELDESLITPSALRRIRILLICSLPFFPLLALGELGSLPEGAFLLTAYYLVAIGSMIATVVLLLTRIISRVWVADKYLDEWERRVKHKSMSVAFMVLCYTLSALFVVGLLYHEFSGVDFPNVDLRVLMFAMGGSMIFGLYVQMIQQLSMIQPMEKDEFGSPTPSRKIFSKSVKWFLFVLVIIFVILPFLAGFVVGFIEAT